MQRRAGHYDQREHPSKRLREVSPVLPADFFDVPPEEKILNDNSLSKGHGEVADVVESSASPEPPSTPSSPSAWARERLLDESWAQDAYDQRAEQLALRRQQLNVSHREKEEIDQKNTPNQAEEAISRILDTDDTSSDEDDTLDWRCSGRRSAKTRTS